MRFEDLDLVLDKIETLSELEIMNELVVQEVKVRPVKLDKKSYLVLEQLAILLDLSKAQVLNKLLTSANLEDLLKLL